MADEGIEIREETDERIVDALKILCLRNGFVATRLDNYTVMCHNAREFTQLRDILLGLRDPENSHLRGEPWDSLWKALNIRFEGSTKPAKRPWLAGGSRGV